jgi:arabinan endo-1,5-alpha-L-arabinosidase
MVLRVLGSWLGWALHVPLTTAAVAGVVVAAAPVRPPQPPPPSPVIRHDFPDPDVLAVGGANYAYSTMSRYGNRIWHVPVAHSTDIVGRWRILGDAMPHLPSWVDPSPPGDGNVWAPDVVARSDGSYLLYFAARSAARKIQCIGTALAPSPQGPFTGVGADPLLCQPQDTDSIDPSPFTDTDGAQYLLYSSGQGQTRIWLQRTSVDGLKLIGKPRVLITANRADEANIVEGPTLVHHGNRYLLFYSGNAYNSGDYFVNYASSRSLAGTFVQHPGQFLTQSTLDGKYANPGRSDIVPTRSSNYLIFHAYTAANRRSMFVVGMDWGPGDQPVLNLHPGAGEAVHLAD